jgi:hypothetical protein
MLRVVQYKMTLKLRLIPIQDDPEKVKVEEGMQVAGCKCECRMPKS